MALPSLGTPNQMLKSRIHIYIYFNWTLIVRADIDFIILGVFISVATVGGNEKVITVMIPWLDRKEGRTLKTRKEERAKLPLAARCWTLRLAA